ncbi:Hypothetical predicted protein, partial [Paramuricea clavata]
MSELCTNPPNDLDELVACYNNTLKAHFDKYAPPKTKTITIRARVPWFNEQLRKAKHERRNAERKWRVSKSDVDFVNFKGKQNLVNRLMCKARTKYYTSFIEENSGDQKKLFNASKRLFGQHHDDGLPPNLNCEAFVSDIGKYFVQKIGNIRRKLDNNKVHALSRYLQNTSVPHAVEESVPKFSEFSALTELDVKTLIGRAALKTCNLDPMPSKLVSQCDALFPIITRIINLSLQTGQFPQLWKEALVHPLLKKAGFDVAYGVPQGSCLGPLLFTIYVSKLCDIVQRHLPDVHCYADDSQLYVAFRPKVESEQSDAVTAMERCIEDIRKWMSEDKLLLNDEKTEFLLIGTKQQLAKVNLDHITVGTTDIAPQPVAKNLRLYTQSCKKDHTRQSQASSSSTTMANTVMVPYALTNTGATTGCPFTTSESVTAAVQASAETPSTQEAKTSYLSCIRGKLQ